MNRNDAFWKLIDEVETASFLLGREDCTENQRRREAARTKLEQWLEAAGGFDPIDRLMAMSPEDRDRIVEETIRAPKLRVPEPCLVEAEVGEDAFVGASLTIGDDGRLRLRKDGEAGCGLAGDNLYAGYRARLDLGSILTRWMSVEL